MVHTIYVYLTKSALDSIYLDFHKLNSMGRIGGEKTPRHRKTELNLIASQQQVQYFFVVKYMSIWHIVYTEKFRKRSNMENHEQRFASQNSWSFTCVGFLLHLRNDCIQNIELKRKK